MTRLAGHPSRSATKRLLTLAPPKVLVSNAVWVHGGINDPQAVFAAPYYYFGSQSNAGDVLITQWDIVTGALVTFNLAPAFEVEDHDNPTILIRPDGRIIVFYALHNNPDGTARMRTTTNPGDITAWGAPVIITSNTTHPTLQGFTYPKVAMLSAESNRIYMIFRSRTAQQAIMFSDDFGVTWSTPTPLFNPLIGGQRPYAHIATNHVDTIHVAITEDHPVTTQNNYYHFKIRGGHCYRSDDTLIGPVASGVAAAQATKIYDHATDGRAWGWDLVLHPTTGEPHAAWATLPDDLTVARAGGHHAWAGRHTPSGWQTSQVAVMGGTLHTDPVVGVGTGVEYYSYGICLDPDDPDRAYVGVQKAADAGEIELWTTSTAGSSWAFSRKISEADTKNYRPVKEAGAPVIWLGGAPGAPFGGYRNFVNFASRVLTPYASIVAP